MPYADPEVARRESARRMREMRARRAAERPPPLTAERVRELEEKLRAAEFRLAGESRYSWASVLTEASPGRIAQDIFARRNRKTVMAIRRELAKLVKVDEELIFTPSREDEDLALTLLGLAPHTLLSEHDIAAAYREKAMRLHPDQGGGGDGDVMTALRKARDVLVHILHTHGPSKRRA